jgi:adenylate cyclase
MEQHIAILMADLSGYTALTETHGASTAADLIDKYIEIVEGCLVGDCQLHGRVGDEVIVVSAKPDCLISTTILLIQNISKENNFLQVHGGLHYGKILKRNNDYFGTAINLASRIANKATPGNFLCSEEFVNALENKSACEFKSKGKHSFKNISQEKEVFEVVMSEQRPLYVDPVCRMLISSEEKATPHPSNEKLFFCSADCLDIYVRSNP